MNIDVDLSLSKIDFSSVRILRVHKEQYDAIESKAKSVILTCIEDGRCLTLDRSYRNVIAICTESSYPDLHVGDIISNNCNLVDTRLKIETKLKKIMASTKGLDESHFELLKDGVEFTDFALTVNDFEYKYDWYVHEDKSEPVKKTVVFKIFL